MNCSARKVLSLGLRSMWTSTKQKFGKYGVVQPGTVSEMKVIPPHIQTPPYYKSGVPTGSPDTVEVKNKEQISRMKESCKMAASVLKAVGESIEVGQTTDQIDNLVHQLTIEGNAYPSPLNYHNFPKSVCTSVNNVACHGIPDDRPLENGDIINVDITVRVFIYIRGEHKRVYFNGYHGDCSKTFLVGEVDEKGRDLVAATETCLNDAISICTPGQKFSNIGLYIEQRAKEMGFNVIPCFIGHGIGSYFHGPPDIYHFANFYPGVMTPGMTFTIEPILTPGGQEIIILDDNWTAITSDNARTAQFEHTVLITPSGCEVLTIV